VGAITHLGGVLTVLSALTHHRRMTMSKEPHSEVFIKPSEGYVGEMDCACDEGRDHFVYVEEDE
jgi:hypothetical protein